MRGREQAVVVHAAAARWLATFASSVGAPLAMGKQSGAVVGAHGAEGLVRVDLPELPRVQEGLSADASRKGLQEPPIGRGLGSAAVEGQRMTMWQHWLWGPSGRRGTTDRPASGR